MAISGNGNTAVGYAAYDNMGRIEPLIWRRGASDKWTLSKLEMPEGVKNINICTISGGGHLIIAGASRENDQVAVYWKDGVPGIISGPAKAHPDDFNNIQPLAVSNNGRYVVLSINFEACIYDMVTEEYHNVKPLGDFAQISRTVAIDDDGNLYGNYTGYPDCRPFVYFYKDGRTVDMGYYLNLAVPGFEEASKFARGSQMCFVSVSPDGTRFAGNTSSYGGSRWKGKYIGSVSALINYLPYYEDVKGTYAAAVIFEEGKIVREQDFGELSYNDYNKVELDQPLQIDGTKELIVGIRLYDYDDWQWPAVAAVADDYMPGKSDIYTEDGGKTWLKLSDLYDVEYIRGHCLLDITANVTDSPEAEISENTTIPFIYTVYRDGAMVNVKAIDGNSTKFCDKKPVENSSYTVAIQSKTGENSAMSAPYVLLPGGIADVTRENAAISFDSASHVVSAGQDALRITLYDTEGRIVASSDGNSLSVAGVTSGMYVVTVSYPGKILPAKLLVR